MCCRLDSGVRRDAITAVAAQRAWRTILPSKPRFHIVAKTNAAPNDVRGADARRLAEDGYEPILKKTRWCVLKRKANLTEPQRFRLRDLPRYNLRTVRAYQLTEDFQQFWEYEPSSWAGEFLDEWCR